MLKSQIHGFIHNSLFYAIMFVKNTNALLNVHTQNYVIVFRSVQYLKPYNIYKESLRYTEMPNTWQMREWLIGV